MGVENSKYSYEKVKLLIEKVKTFDNTTPNLAADVKFLKEAEANGKRGPGAEGFLLIYDTENKYLQEMIDIPTANMIEQRRNVEISDVQAQQQLLLGLTLMSSMILSVKQSFDNLAQQVPKTDVETLDRIVNASKRADILSNLYKNYNFTVESARVEKLLSDQTLPTGNSVIKLLSESNVADVKEDNESTQDALQDKTVAQKDALQDKTVAQNEPEKKDEPAKQVVAQKNNSGAPSNEINGKQEPIITPVISWETFKSTSSWPLWKILTIIGMILLIVYAFVIVILFRKDVVEKKLFEPYNE